MFRKKNYDFFLFLSVGQGERADAVARRRGVRLRLLPSAGGGVQAGHPLAHGPANHGAKRHRSQPGVRHTGSPNMFFLLNSQFDAEKQQIVKELKMMDTLV